MSNALEEVRTALQVILDQIPTFEPAQDDLVEEEYQGNAGVPMPLSKRAKMFHSISDPDWDALTEEEKLDYISRLPPKKPHGESNKDEEEDCIDCDDDEQDATDGEEDETDDADETSESDEGDADETTDIVEDELDPDEVIAKYRRTLEDKDYPY